ncbi:hypothetical protein FHS18_005907 [Paenibacillus phyllosphaerae]|uniref:Uncharacterized protein n=1 Tax=Paenibacillus phyllosphaerae TaxID=274593 RepID=A0A7W5B3L5_9BACL|nr:hypothetical protein [Paenibacillus phyllosphaerae]MBB3113794.1 hypothetical protein [Paenibacillus phyllosphaerae]
MVNVLAVLKGIGLGVVAIGLVPFMAIKALSEAAERMTPML